jgi:ABC-2 type transport system permease protein
VIRLIGSELLRFRSRRLVVVLLGASLIGTGVGVVIAASQSTPPTAEALATARAQAREEVALCLEQDWEGVPIEEGSLEVFCEDNFGDPAQYMGSHLRLAELPGILEGISSITSIMGLVVGASIVAVSWQTGTISTILTWEPRRLRWFASRVLVVAAGVLVMTLAIVAFLSAGLAVAAILRGSTFGTDGAWWADVLSTWLRIGVAASISAVIGAAVAAIGRHTAAALGVVFVWTAVVEGLIRGLRPRWTPWLLGDNLVSFLSWESTETQFESFRSFTITPGRALLVIAGYAILALALGFTFVRVRDVQ